MGMRLMYDDLDDPHGNQPYKEGDVYICRNCARELEFRAAYCYSCARRHSIRARLEEMERHEDASD